MKVGDRVICINMKDIVQLKKDVIYTISCIMNDESGVSILLDTNISKSYYNANRFITLKELRRLKLEKISEQSSGFTKSKINENK